MDYAYCPVEDTSMIHSMVRWKKPLDEIRNACSTSSKVNCEDVCTGNTPLHVAAQNGHYDIVKLLIELSANLNAKNENGNTPLHMSVNYDYFDCSRALIDAGADPNIKNKAGHMARQGLDGDKSLEANAIFCAKNAKEFLEAMNDLKKTKPLAMNKVAFVKAGMKLKREIGEEWNSKIQREFKSLLEMWDLEASGELVFGSIYQK